MIKLLHNSLPTKAKVHKNIQQEVKNNNNNGTNNTFWQDKYPHITDDLCPLCNKEPETAEHFMVCKHEYAQEQNKKLMKIMNPKVKNSYLWFLCPKTSSPRVLKGFEPVIGSKGVLPKQINNYLKSATKVSPKQLKTLLIEIQVRIIKTHLKIWKYRNSKLFSSYNAGIT